MSIPTKALTSMPQTQTSTRGQIGQIPYGERPLINVIDERARTGWNRPYASIPRNGQPEEGYEDVSYSRFANAINRCVHWLHSEVGTSNTYEPLAYMGPMDLRYQVLAMAATKAGFSVSANYPPCRRHTILMNA